MSSTPNLCQCGHHKEFHFGGGAMCRWTNRPDDNACACSAYRLAKEPVGCPSCGYRLNLAKTACGRCDWQVPKPAPTATEVNQEADKLEAELDEILRDAFVGLYGRMPDDRDDWNFVPMDDAHGVLRESLKAAIQSYTQQQCLRAQAAQLEWLVERWHALTPDNLRNQAKGLRAQLTNNPKDDE